MRSRLLLAATVTYLLVAAPASAEWFFDPYIGGAFTEKHDVDTDFTGGQFTTLDVSFNNSFAAGLRGGYWLPFEVGPVNFGVGLDVSHFAPNVSRQTRTFCAVGCFTGVFDDFDLSVWTIGFDAMVRFPLLKTPEVPNGRLQPYLSVGPAIFVAHAEDSRNFVPFDQSSTDSSIGVKLSAGVAWMFTKNIGIFGEYRYTHFSPEFGFTDPGLGSAKVSTDINTHYVIVGGSFRF